MDDPFPPDPASQVVFGHQLDGRVVFHHPYRGMLFDPVQKGLFHGRPCFVFGMNDPVSGYALPHGRGRTLFRCFA